MTQRMPRPLVDGRHFKWNENEAHVWRVVDPTTGDAKGVSLTIAFGLYATSPREYFTDDNGRSFWRAALDADRQCLKIRKAEVERDTQKLKILKNVFATWQAASGHSCRRDIISRQCEGLKELLNSLTPETPTLHYSQLVWTVQAKSQTAPDNSVQQLENDLDHLLLTLRHAKAADSQMIINQERFEQFLADVMGC